MTDEQKKLMLKEIGSRYPYDLYVEYIYYPIPDKGEVGIKSKGEKYFKSTALVRGIIDNEVEIWGYGKMPVEDVKLVLRPLSSISKQEIKELEILLDRTYNFWFNETEVIPYIDFLISHHFDYRGLIDMGLAIIDENDIYSKL